MKTARNTDLHKCHERLLQDRQMLTEQLAASDHYGLGQSLRDGTGELSVIDNHPADVATEIYERSKDSVLLEQEELHLQRIEAALQAWEDGTYGQCLTCKASIPQERLNALPDTLYCIEHAPRQELSERRPAEESVMPHPFGRSSRDGSEEPGIDGEDVWQIVERWGTSDSPAMAEHDVDDYDQLMIEADENDGYVESLESFLATDITGSHVTVVPNRKYREYLAQGEGDTTLSSFDDESDIGT
ncbi:molecular chaperone DnaK [Paenibacillaceae bacterium]|nr:molecular chaperone DnaK [Paenibacillaceae bacterium]